MLAGGGSGVGSDPMTDADTSGHLLDCPRWQAPRDHPAQVRHRHFGEVEAPRRGAGAPLGSLGWALWLGEPLPHPPAPPNHQELKELNSHLIADASGLITMMQINIYYAIIHLRNCQDFKGSAEALIRTL